MMLRKGKKSERFDWSVSIPACDERPLRARTSLVEIRISSNGTLFRVKKPPLNASRMLALQSLLTHFIRELSLRNVSELDKVSIFRRR